jgi:amino acid adenylation domain-containing protein/thioester reductase-like protein
MQSSTVFNPSIMNADQLIAAQAALTPDAIALVFEDQQITYQSLNHQANQLSHYLIAEGVKPETLVGVYIERSPMMVIALLAILKAGGAYLPLDPAFPAERIALMIEDSQTPILLSQQQYIGEYSHVQNVQNVKFVALDQDWPPIVQHYSGENPNPVATPKNLAYTIYTSGSTGRPKGVQITHANMVNFLQSMQRSPGLSATDRLLAVTTISFDIAVLELFLPLMVGAQIILATRTVAADPVRLAQLLATSDATCMQATPATWRMLLAAKWAGSPGLKILCGGEALTRNLADQLLIRCDSLWNMYGPTETTVWSMIAQVTASDCAIPLGEPIDNTQIYIIKTDSRRQDDVLEDAAVGESGELYIGGAGVARGYRDRPELTQEKFIADVLSTDPTARLYKTGDLARVLPNGDIEIIGRADNQVKIRGYRIELGDIETSLSQHPDLREGVVIAPEDSSGERRLVAYVVRQPNADLTASSLRAWLTTKLPIYMVPSLVVFMDELPLTPNCKIDRRALPVPSLDPEEALTPPRTELEAMLTELWSDVLERAVGIEHNFLECGGDSLRTALLLSRVQEIFQVQVPLECLFQAPTVATFAEILMVVQAAGSAAQFQMTAADLNREAMLDPQIQPQTAVKANRQQLFITGATGFIGAFLMQELLHEYPQATLYCLVRADSMAEAADRLRETLVGYEIWDDRFGPRIMPVLGDLAQPLFGLSETQFGELADRVDVIYHSGAYVNLVYPYAALRSANVVGTQEVLRLATTGQTLPVHYISTIDVFHSRQYHGPEPIFETDRLISAEGYVEGYAQTKWVAEKLVMSARDRGVPVCIYRLGMITGHSETGGFQLGNLIVRMAKGFIQLGTAPDLDLEMVLAPVDYVVKSIVHLSCQPEALGQTFHIVSPHRLSLRQLVADINAAGYPVAIVPTATWQKQLRQAPHENALTPAISMFSAPCPGEAIPIVISTFVAQTHDDRQAQTYLVGAGITCPPVSGTMIRTYLAYFHRQGFQPAAIAPSI